MKLSIIIPVYNEEKTLLEIIKKVESIKLPNIEKEIIIIDDYSTDSSKDILKELEKSNKYKIFYHKTNQGKGAALRTGFKNSSGDIILIQDADLEYDPNDYIRLLEPILNKETKVVYGSRLTKTKKHMYSLHHFGNWFLTFLTNILYSSHLTDMETCYKVFTKEVLSSMTLKAKRFDFEPEITAKILKKGYKIKEIPISFHGRHFEEGKKITWVDGLKAMYYLLKYRFLD
jgi:dolichol-phosphate mannosyltransferase